MGWRPPRTITRQNGKIHRLRRGGSLPLTLTWEEESSMSFAVMGTGSYVPPRVVTNEELSQFVDTTDEWITQRVGVKQRYVCTT